ncbi:MAG: hypothetical protein KGD63_00125 [Candidatus Lokiarchaeota archaeon]|nr:hypothetical protein [Candidatus Lokiarchaeota archaeon]
MVKKKELEERELECYSYIIKLFSKFDKDPVSIDKWKNNLITRLMGALTNPKNENWLKNALIILLSLVDKNPSDLYANIGENLNILSKEEKDQIFSKLKEEFSEE